MYKSALFQQTTYFSPRRIRVKPLTVGFIQLIADDFEAVECLTGDPGELRQLHVVNGGSGNERFDHEGRAGDTHSRSDTGSSIGAEMRRQVDPLPRLRVNADCRLNNRTGSKPVPATVADVDDGV